MLWWRERWEEDKYEDGSEEDLLLVQEGHLPDVCWEVDLHLQ